MRKYIYSFAALMCVHTICMAQTPYPTYEKNSTWVAPVYYPLGGGYSDDVAINFNYYATNTPISFINAKFNEVANTKGSRYIFDTWANGSVTTSNGAVIANDSILFNVDKLKNSLLLRRSDGTVIEIDKNQINSFGLKDSNTVINFERVTEIDPNQYLIVLDKKENGFAAYKSVSTTFKKANYTSDGLMQSGNDYDEYADSYKYYILIPDKSFKMVYLKLKSIKEALSGNTKANDFFAQHKNDAVDENYLTSLIEYLNS